MFTCVITAIKLPSLASIFSSHHFNASWVKFWFLKSIMMLKMANTQNMQYLLQTAGAQAAATAQRSGQRDHLLAHIVLDVEDEGAERSTAVPVTAVVLLSHVEDLLPECVLHQILVVRFPS